jgi:hypothetical protein
MRTLLFRSIPLLSALFSALAAPAQPEQVPVKGIVVDGNSGEPVIGATINIDGTDQFVITGLDGRFNITTYPGLTLIFSCLGYETEQQVVSEADGGREMTVYMVEDYEDLGIYEGPIGRRKTHHATVEAAYSGSWGYGLGYLYRDGYVFPYHFHHFLRNYIGLGVRMTLPDPGADRWTVNPYIQFELGMVPWKDRHRLRYSWRLRHLPVAPYANVGYAFDTDFHTSEKGRFAYGAGINIRRLPRFVRFLTFGGYVRYTAGYNGFAGAPERNYWSLGLHIGLHKIHPIMLY